jgi:uncharacterized surface protein with fasciclin (FAS1) repeats
MSDKISNTNNPICFFDITIGNTVIYMITSKIIYKSNINVSLN